MLLQSTSFLLHCNPKNSFCLSLQGVSEDVRECIAGLAGIQAGRSETQSPGTETLLPKGSIREYGEFFFCGACGSTIFGTMEGRPSLILTQEFLMEQIGSFPGLIFGKPPHKNGCKGLRGN